jgi:hypothetical protein
MTRRKNQEGFALATVALWAIGLVALAAIAVDVSRLAYTATEVQAVADVAATSGAKAAAKNGDPVGDAKAAAARNRADGALFDVDGQPTLYGLEAVAGKYDPAATPSFVPSDPPWNAVRATATAKQVAFVFGGFFSALGNLVNGGNAPLSTSTPITKTATAVCAPPSGLPPDLPITVCPDGNVDLHIFQPGEACDPARLGTISPLNPLPNTTQDACWTDLGTGFGNPSNNDLLHLFPPDCGGTGTPPTVADAQVINLNNGSHNGLFNDLVACVNAAPYNGTRNFTIPVIDCGPCANRAAPVRGFVTIQIKAADIKTNAGNVGTFGSCNVPCPAGGCPQGIYCAKQVCNASGTGIGIGTGDNFGDCIVRLTQ